MRSAGDGMGPDEIPERESPAEGAAALSSELRESIRVLLWQPEEELRESMAGVLSGLGYSLHVCSRTEDAIDGLLRRVCEIAILDIDLPPNLARPLLDAAGGSAPATSVVVITGRAQHEWRIDPPASSAWQYLAKPFTSAHLALVVERVAYGIAGARRARALHQEINASHGHSDKVAVIGKSAALRQVIELARRVAPTEAPVFITGESGCGKEQIAQFIHANSRRAAHPLVALNCAALPEALLESEMFGHRRGAFTGALVDKPGLLEVAHAGSLLLDEITEMPVTLQAKLLRVIQDGEVRRIGSTSTDAVVDVRFIAATNRSPQDAIRDGLLRRDLYYRLRVVPIHIPPLRERAEDIPVLASYFLQHYWTRHRVGEMPPPVLGAEAIAVLQARPWPGNVRELQNTIEYAVVVLEPGQVVGPEDLFLAERATPPPEIAPVVAGAEEYHAARDRMLTQFERSYLTWLLERAGGNLSKAARLGGVDRTTLYRLMDKHGLHRDVLLTQKD